MDDERLLIDSRANTFSRLNPVVGDALGAARLLDRHRLRVGIRAPSRDVNSDKAASVVVRFFRGYRGSVVKSVSLKKPMS